MLNVYLANLNTNKLQTDSFSGKKQVELWEKDLLFEHYILAHLILNKCD